jgi:hypothetical protein
MEYQILIEPDPDQYRVFRGRLREVGLAEFGDRLGVSTPSTPSSTSCWRIRATVTRLVSRPGWRSSFGRCRRRAGRACPSPLRIGSPCDRMPIPLDWSTLEVDPRAEAEILASLERPRPAIPQRVHYAAHIGLWDGSLRQPGLRRTVEQFRSGAPDAVATLAAAAAASFRRSARHPDGPLGPFYPVGTDGELPEELDATTRRRFLHVVECLGDDLLSALKRQIPGLGRDGRLPGRRPKGAAPLPAKSGHLSGSGKRRLWLEADPAMRRCWGPSFLPAPDWPPGETAARVVGISSLCSPERPAHETKQGNQHEYQQRHPDLAADGRGLRELRHRRDLRQDRPSYRGRRTAAPQRPRRPPGLGAHPDRQHQTGGAKLRFR